MPAGHRLGLNDYTVDDERRGEICERWFGSTAKADNTFGPEDEGLSYIACQDGSRLLLRDAISCAGEIILGEEYCRSHRFLNAFTKLFDYAIAVPFHLHQMEKNIALKGKRPKEEAYYFLENVQMGSFPYSFFGVHPSIARPENREKIIPYLKRWQDDEMLKFSKAYKLVPGEGFLLPAGTLHAPGTALTLEIQEASDVANMFTPPIGNSYKSIDLLWKDVDFSKRSFTALLDLVNWDVSGDPYFYEHYHLTPVPVDGSFEQSGKEFWIFYGTHKFSGKKVVIPPHSRIHFREKGAFTLFVWQGTGELNTMPVEAGGDHSKDEFFFVHDAANLLTIAENTGNEDFIFFKLFGEDINNLDAPSLQRFP
jgi:hypothetical protein